MSFFSNLFGQRSTSAQFPETTTQNTPKHSEPQPSNFRKTKDINNVVPYASLHLRENQLFFKFS